MKYKVIEQAVPSDVVKYLQYYTNEAMCKTKNHQGSAREKGSGIYWGGICMASSLPLATDEENKKLFNIYTSDFMYNIITEYIKEPYLFNDQIVVKDKNVNMTFDSHCDNDLGPFPGDKSLLTINCMIVLDDFTDENGTIEVYNGESWIKLYPKTGDIVLIEGNVFHRSSPNTTDMPRRAYLCIYSNKSIGKNFKSGFYYQKFTKQIR